MDEFIALAVPMKHGHAPGMCNKGMTSKLRKHMAKDPDEEGDEEDLGDDDMTNDIGSFEEDNDESSGDPRWNSLKDFNENDNN